MAPWYLYAILYTTMAVNLGCLAFNLWLTMKWRHKWQSQWNGAHDRAKMIGYLSGYEAGKRAVS